MSRIQSPRLIFCAIRTILLASASKGEKVTRFINNFNVLARCYQQSHVKPDKQYSILPTILKLVGDLQGKTVLDLGCGDGFFSRPMAQSGAKWVIGLDNSEEQLKLAGQWQLPNLELRLADIFQDDLPMADVINAPFVANYANTSNELTKFFVRVNGALNKNGRAVFVMDIRNFPCGNLGYRRMRAVGATKMTTGDYPGIFGPNLSVTLWNGGRKPICVLRVRQHSQIAIQTALQEAGFQNIRWHLPIVSAEGIERYDKKFWDGYPEHCELAYITARHV